MAKKKPLGNTIVGGGFQNYKDNPKPEVKPEVLPVGTKQSAQDPNKVLTTSETIFNPDGTRKIKTGGEEFDLSKEEFSASIGQAGVMSPQVERLKNLESQQKLQAKVIEGLKTGKSIKQITDEFIASQSQGGFNTLKQDLSTPITEQGVKEDVANAPRSIASQVLTPLAPQLEKVSDLPIVSDVLQQAAIAVNAVGKFLPEAAQIPGISGKQSAEVTTATQAFSDTSTLVADSIDRLRMGMGNAEDVKRNIDIALADIKALEGATHGSGRLNPNFWVDKGRSIESQVAKEISILEDLRIKAITAEQEGQIARTRALYGL